MCHNGQKKNSILIQFRDFALREDICQIQSQKKRLKQNKTKQSVIDVSHLQSELLPARVIMFPPVLSVTVVKVGVAWQGVLCISLCTSAQKDPLSLPQQRGQRDHLGQDTDIHTLFMLQRCIHGFCNTVDILPLCLPLERHPEIVLLVSAVMIF